MDGVVMTPPVVRVLCPSCGKWTKTNRDYNGMFACIECKAGFRSDDSLTNAQVYIRKLQIENERLRAEQAAVRRELVELWNDCADLPHASGCDSGHSGYCDCERGKFNSFLYNICVNHDALKGGER
jgi:hypothetical protein